MMAMASGWSIPEPCPMPSASGSSARIAATDVNVIARIRCEPAAISRSRSVPPWGRSVKPELGGGLRFQIAYGPAGVALNVFPEPVGFSTLALVAQAWLLWQRQHVPRS
jgi:hypothetical protein